MLKPIRLFSIVAALAVLAVGAAVGGRSERASAQVAVLALPGAVCGDGVASVTFNWTPVAGASVQYVDISIFDNGFAPGSFIGTAAGGSANSLTWNGILTGTPHVWRVNALTASGWITSETGAFVPCGAPAPLSAGPGCQDRYLSTIQFRWAPVIPAPVAQYLDLGYDPGFAPGTFYGNGLPVTMWSLSWPNIPANLTQYYRVNSLGADGVWRTSAVGAVTAGCAPSNPGGEIALGDRLIIPAAGIDVEVRSSKVSTDTGYMTDPNGYFHATWYDFSSFAGLGGYAHVGNMAIAGHVDCGTCNNGGVGTAVFWNVLNLGVGDTAQYITADGRVINYVVVNTASVDPNIDWAPIVSAGAADMTLITCVGTFSGGEYSSRHVVQLRRY